MAVPRLSLSLILKTEFFIILAVLAFLGSLRAYYGRYWRIGWILYEKPLRLPVDRPEIGFDLAYEKLISEPK